MALHRRSILGENTRDPESQGSIDDIKNKFLLAIILVCTILLLIFIIIAAVSGFSAMSDVDELDKVIMSQNQNIAAIHSHLDQLLNETETNKQQIQLLWEKIAEMESRFDTKSITFTPTPTTKKSETPTTLAPETPTTTLTPSVAPTVASTTITKKSGLAPITTLATDVPTTLDPTSPSEAPESFKKIILTPITKPNTFLESSTKSVK